MNNYWCIYVLSITFLVGCTSASILSDNINYLDKEDVSGNSDQSAIGNDLLSQHPNDPTEKVFQDGKFKVTFLNVADPLEVNLVSIREELVEIRIIESGAMTEFPRSDLITIEEQITNSSNKGVIYGAFLGAIPGGIISWSTAKTSVEGNVETTTFNMWPVYISSAIGALIGSVIQRRSSKEWVQLYPQVEENES